METQRQWQTMLVVQAESRISVTHLLLPRRPSVGMWMLQPTSGTDTTGTYLLLLVAGFSARNKMPPLAKANHFVAIALSPSDSGGQLASACV
jgi:hypothetical protein